MKTANSERVHIGLFGATNSGKSTLLNFISGTDTAIVSDQKGTTTDPIRKAMEITDFGPVLLIDTAGSLDNSELSEKRLEKTRNIIDKTDIFLYLLSLDDDGKLLEQIKKKNKPIIYIASKNDLAEGEQIFEKYKDLDPVRINVKDLASRNGIFERIKEVYKKDKLSITRDLVKEGDMVLLVMPQDKASPKDRLIKPQVMTIRELIDKKATAIVTGLENFEKTLEKVKPDLIITDSQVFKEVYDKKPSDVRLTSFSVLFSAFKGCLLYTSGAADDSPPV